MQHERGDRTARRASLEHPPSGPLAAASYLIRARGTDRVVIEVSGGTQVLLLSQPTDVVEPLRSELWVHCRHGDVEPRVPPPAPIQSHRRRRSAGICDCHRVRVAAVRNFRVVDEPLMAAERPSCAVR